MLTTAQKKLSKQANNTDEKQFEESIFPEIFDEVARNCYVEQMDSFGKLFENSDFYKNVMTQMAKVMYENYKKQEIDFPFVPIVFIEKLIQGIQNEFTEIQQYLRPSSEIAECLIKVINAQTISSIDGVNDILLDSFNRLYCLKNMKLVDKRRHFNTIVTKFEVFLKKLYYLIHKTEMRSGRDEASMPTFVDCILAFSCLRGLRHNSDTRYQKFSSYLESVKEWRNNESHIAPDATAQELGSAIHVVTTMYFFVISQSMMELDCLDI